MPLTYFPNSYASAVAKVLTVSGVATFDLHTGNVQQIGPLTANTTAAITNLARASGTVPTGASAASGRFTFIIVQNASAAKTFTWPANVIGGMTISATLSSINVQTFVVSAAGLTLYACDAGSTGMTGGTP